MVGGSIFAAVAIAVGNTLAPLSAAWLLRRLDVHPALDRRRDIPFFLGAGALLPMLISASGRVERQHAAESAALGLAMLWIYLTGITVLNQLVTGLAAGYRQVEQALREREVRLTEAQRLAHLGSWDLDLTNNRLEWSAEIYRILAWRSAGDMSA